MQLKFGAMTGAKSFVPPARTAVRRRLQPKRSNRPPDLPDWLPLYPGAKPEGISVITEPETGKRVGSYFFRTSDEIEQVHDL